MSVKASIEDMQAVSDALDSYRNRHPMGRMMRGSSYVVTLDHLAEAIERVSASLSVEESATKSLRE